VRWPFPKEKIKHTLSFTHKKQAEKKLRFNFVNTSFCYLSATLRVFSRFLSWWFFILFHFVCAFFVLEIYLIFIYLAFFALLVALTRSSLQKTAHGRTSNKPKKPRAHLTKPRKNTQPHRQQKERMERAKLDGKSKWTKHKIKKKKSSFLHKTSIHL
jgi:hypothetical protein